MAVDEIRALAPMQLDEERSLIIRPVGTVEELVGAIKQYEAIKAAILLQRDTQQIGDRTHIKKSGWLRIARAFGISCKPVSSAYVVDADAHDWGYEVVVKAVAPNGAEMSGDGACWVSEKKQANQKTRHNVRAHAFTRAMNRAISNLVGGGEVSAEELSGDYVDADPAPQMAPRPMRPAPKPAPAKRRDWATLALRAKNAGIYETVEELEAYCVRILGPAFDRKRATAADYDAVEQAIADKEAENHDLSELHIPADRP